MKDIYQEPYRIFFPLGILLGSIGAGHWLFYSLGWMPSYSGFVHAAVQTQLYIGCFIIGFLLTSIPRFASAPAASAVEFFSFIFLILAATVCFLTTQPVIAELLFILTLGNLVLFIGRRFKKRSVSSAAKPPLEFVWIPIGVLHGIIGASMIIAINLKWIHQSWILTARPMVEQGFLLSVVTGIGGFMAPRLMGRNEIIQRFNPDDVETFNRQRGQRLMFYLLSGILLFSSFWIEKVNIRVAYLIRAIIPTVIFFKNHAFPHWPKIQETYVRLLWLSIGFLLIGNWMVVIMPLYRKAMLHFVFVGGFSLMTFAVATMVIYSHSGDLAGLRKTMWSLRIVLIGVVVALATRVASDFIPKTYFLHLGVASFIWIATGLIWLYCMIPKLQATPSPEEFERCHDEAKKRIRES